MSSKLPPTPEENRSPKGAGDNRLTEADAGPRGRRGVPDPDKQGEQGNRKVNTTHQGNQQDR